MALPVDIPGTALAFLADVLDPVGLKVYSPPTASAGDSWATAVTVYGVRMRRRVEVLPIDQGGGRVTRATWYVVTANTPMNGTRPRLKSLIVDGAEEWTIDKVTPDAADVVMECSCTLSNG